MTVGRGAIPAWALAALVSLAAWMSGPAHAQSEPLALRSPILTIDSARLFPETLLGQAILAEIDEERRAFNRENEILAQEFREEELELTQRRATLPREEFAELAAQFDERVQAARAERDAREAEIDRAAELRRRAFSQQVLPVLDALMREAGAAVLIESDSVLLAAEAVDITAAAIARINQAVEAEGLQVPATGDE
ncbi:MAG: OmpH family outer membrane protein [Pseudomonadota bacterium]